MTLLGLIEVIKRKLFHNHEAVTGADNVKDIIVNQWNDYISVHGDRPNAILLGKTSYDEVKKIAVDSDDALSIYLLPSLTVFIDKDNNDRIEVFSIQTYELSHEIRSRLKTCDQ